VKPLLPPIYGEGFAYPHGGFKYLWIGKHKYSAEFIALLVCTHEQQGRKKRRRRGRKSKA